MTNKKIENTSPSVLREDISKKLKALEIIKEKNVNVPKLRNSSNLEEYNRCFRDKCLLTQEEFDLLKEVLK